MGPKLRIGTFLQLILYICTKLLEERLEESSLVEAFCESFSINHCEVLAREMLWCSSSLLEYGNRF